MKLIHIPWSLQIPLNCAGICNDKFLMAEESFIKYFRKINDTLITDPQYNR